MDLQSILQSSKWKLLARIDQVPIISLFVTACLSFLVLVILIINYSYYRTDRKLMCCYNAMLTKLFSGAEDKQGYLWDRHYRVCLERYSHDDVVNCVAFCPSDPEILVSVSDDSTIKVWRSQHRMRGASQLCFGLAMSTSHETSVLCSPD